MLPTFVIGLREGLEASLIVGIIAAFLVQEGRREALRPMWLGVGVAVGICVAIGAILQVADQELPQRQQEALETVIGLLAVGVVTFMIVWMRRHARGLGRELRASAASALASGSMAALVGMAFFAVLREGVETAVFLIAAFNASTNAVDAGIGAALGILVAVAIGVGIYKGGIKINLNRFFKGTGLVLVLVAAGLLATAAHTANEAGWITGGQAEALNLSWLVQPGTWTASLLTGMLGLQPHPTVVEVAAWLIYAGPMLLFLLWPERWRPRRASVVSAGAVLVLLLALAGCGSSGDGSSGSGAGKAVKLTITDSGCRPAGLKLAAGPHTFDVSNDGADKVTELELLQNGRILGERENLTPGLSGSFSLNLKAGRYQLYCPNADTERVTLTVTGSGGGSNINSAALRNAVRGYDAFVIAQTEALAQRTR